MKILALPGSISSDSINKKFVYYVASLFNENHDVETLDLLDYEMPLFSNDREREIGIHPLAQQLADKIDDADLILLSLAEYNSAYSGAFKNTFDWLSRIPTRTAFGDKPMFLLSTAPGPGGGKNVTDVFLKRAPFSGAKVITNFCLPEFDKNFSAEEGIMNEELKKEFNEKLDKVKAEIEN